MTIFYEEYINDYSRRFKQEYFRTGDFYTVKKWILGLCISGDYKDDMYVPNPDHRLEDLREPSRIEVNNYRSLGYATWIHKIEENGKIIYSDGKHTAGIKHWNEDTKQLCRDLYKAIHEPTFNFG